MHEAGIGQNSYLGRITCLEAGGENGIQIAGGNKGHGMAGLLLPWGHNVLEIPEFTAAP